MSSEMGQIELQALVIDTLRYSATVNKSLYNIYKEETQPEKEELNTIREQTRKALLALCQAAPVIDAHPEVALVAIKNARYQLFRVNAEISGLLQNALGGKALELLKEAAKKGYVIQDYLIQEFDRNRNTYKRFVVECKSVDSKNILDVDINKDFLLHYNDARGLLSHVQGDIDSFDKLFSKPTTLLGWALDPNGTNSFESNLARFKIRLGLRNLWYLLSVGVAGSLIGGIIMYVFTHQS